MVLCILGFGASRHRVANSGVTQPRIECFEAPVTHTAVLCIPRFGVSKHWRPNTGVVKPRTECFEALLTHTQRC